MRVSERYEEALLSSNSIKNIKNDNRNGRARFKARLVVCGYVHRRGIHFDAAYSPVAQYDSAVSVRRMVLCRRRSSTNSRITVFF